MRHHQPGYVLLENVPNFRRHDDGKTWAHLERLLRRLRYDVRISSLSPHKFGIPQIRERVYIVASRTSLDHFEWPKPAPSGDAPSIKSVLDRSPADARRLSSNALRCLVAWQEFLRRMPKDEKIPHPLWSMEFGATYPFENTTPHALSAEKLRAYKGTHGTKSSRFSFDQRG